MLYIQVILALGEVIHPNIHPVIRNFKIRGDDTETSVAYYKSDMVRRDPLSVRAISR